MRGDIASEVLLSAPTLDGGRCCVCGAPAENRHHVVAKGMGGTTTEGPTVPLCGFGNTSGCHRLAHGLGLSFTYSERSGWWYRLTDDAARDVSKRRARFNLHRVRAGEHPCLRITQDAEISDGEPIVLSNSVPLADEPETADGHMQGSELFELEEQLRDLRASESLIAYTEGVVLREARRVFERTVPGKMAAKKAYTEWYTDNLGLDRGTVSKRELYATLPRSAADLGPTKGYYTARVVAERLALEVVAIADARAMSVSDFRATYWPRTDKTERTLICPDCGVVHAACMFKDGGQPSV